MTPNFYFGNNHKSAVVLLDSSLKWEKILKEAEQLIEKGFSIVWELKLDLFSLPLSHEGAFKTIEFTLNEFNDQIYTRFEKSSMGVILYKGSVDFPIIQAQDSDQSVFQQRIHTHRKGIDYLKSLTAILPDTLPIFLLFNEEHFLLSETCFDTFCVATKKTTHPNILPTYGWNRFSPLGYFSDTMCPQKIHEEYSSALLLPPIEAIEEPFLEKANQLLHKSPSKIIPESFLTENWQGIETLFLFPEYLTPQGKRYIAGFKAAGGQILEFS